MRVADLPGLPRDFSAEPAVLRLLGGDSVALSRGRARPPTATSPRLSTGLFILLGARPFTNSAILAELIERGSEPCYGGQLARGVARRLGISPSELVRGGNYVSRIRPSVRALRDLGVLETVPGTARVRGRPELFRLRDGHRDVVLSVLNAFQNGTGLPWVQGVHESTAEVRLQRATRLTWERRFGEARAELRRGPAASSRATGARTTGMQLLRAEAWRNLGDLERNRGRPQVAMQLLRRAGRQFRSNETVAGSPRRAREGLGRTLSLLGELEAGQGDLRRGERDLREGGRLLLELSCEPDPGWQIPRSHAVGLIALSHVQIVRGDFAAAIDLTREAGSRLTRLESEFRDRLHRADRANLEMNRGRASTIEAIALHLEGRSCRRAARTATILAMQAVRTSGGANPVIWRRLGIALRVRVALARLDPATGVVRHGLLLRARHAFLRSIALSPAEADTLFEYARFLRLVDGGLSRGNAPGAELSRVLATARRSAPRHPALRLDEGLATPRAPSPAPRLAPASLVGWLLPSV